MTGERRQEESFRGVQEWAEMLEEMQPSVMLCVGNELKDMPMDEKMHDESRDWAVNCSIEYVRVPFTPHVAPRPAKRMCS